MTFFEQALSRLDEFSNFEKIAHVLKPAFSLDGERAILKRLGNPQTRYPIVHVAGTVGKGSVCFIIEAALRAAGFRTGLYISPHIHDIRERMRINNKLITKIDFARLYGSVAGPGRARPDKHTYFDALTAMAFLYFAEQNVDIAVIETGLGGRLDCTNVAPSRLSVITRIGLDHTAVLGKTLTQIAAEKAGIVKPKSHLVVLKQSHAVNRVMEQTCLERKAGLTWADPAEYDALPPLNLPVAFQQIGYYRENLCVARTALAALAGIGFAATDRHLEKALARIDMPARLQTAKIHKRGGAVLVVLDAAHNPQAARALQAELERLAAGRPVRFVLGMMRDKDANGFLRAIAPLAATIVCVNLHAPRAWPVEELAARASKLCPDVRRAGTVDAALNLALLAARPGDTICFTGSFYALDQARHWLDQKNFSCKIS